MDDYEGEEEDEISFPEGAVVDVLQKRLDGWWVVRYEDQTGLAPGTFLRKVQTDLVNVPSLSDTVTDSTCTQSLSLPPSLSPSHTYTPQPIISEDQESDSFPAPNYKRREAYENVQLQMARAQPPRR